MNKNIIENKLIYNLNRVTGERKPITADIFLTNFCNNKCHYCTFGRWDELQNHKTYMAYDEFVKNTEKLIEFGIKGIILTGGGEPTINPDFDKIAGYLEEEEIPYGINTNFVEYKEISPTYLKVSLDAHDAETYERNRGVNKYNQVISNIKKYISWKKENNVRTNIGLQILVTEREEILNFYNAHKDLEVDYIVFRPYESTLGTYYKNENPSGIISTLEKLAEKDSRVIVNYKWYNLDVKFDKCYAHWSQISLNEKGDITYCCHKPYEIICNIQDNNAFDKWKEAKTDMNRCDIPCRLTGPNKFIREIEENKKDTPFI